MNITTILDRVRRLHSQQDRLSHPILKTCPFCGARAVVYSHMYLWLVECASFDTCGSHGPIRNTPEDAASAWNERIV